MAGPIFRTYSLAPRGGPGLACDDEGLALGPVTLAKKVHDDAGGRRYRLLSLEDAIQALGLAYGQMPDPVIERRCRGLARVTQLLGTGSDALARIHAVLLGFPEIAPDGMAKLATVASLRKSNPGWEDEPRVPAGNPDGGQWTTDGDDGDRTDPSDEHVAMSPECEEEWAAARLRCLDYQQRGLLGKRGAQSFGRTFEQCVRGQVSAACGGSPTG
jgi:hypothetical protein